MWRAKPTEILLQREKHAHFEKSEARAVAIIGPAAVEQVSRRLDAVEADHVLTQHIRVDDIGVCPICWSEMDAQKARQAVIWSE